MILLFQVLQSNPLTNSSILPILFQFIILFKFFQILLPNFQGSPIQGGDLNDDQYHDSHSRQFRSNIVDEHAYWNKVLNKCELLQQQQQQ